MKTVEKEEYDASVVTAKKIQADLDKLGPSIPSNLTAERKRELDAIAKDLSPAQWEILAQQAVGLSASISEVQDPDYAKIMVERKKLQKQHEAELKAKHLKERPWTKPEIRSYMRNFVKNQSSLLFGSGWTQQKVWGFSDTQLTSYYDMLITKLHTSGMNVPDVLEKRGRLLGGSITKKPRLNFLSSDHRCIIFLLFFGS
jgi:hypothetical protein